MFVKGLIISTSDLQASDAADKFTMTANFNGILPQSCRWLMTFCSTEVNGHQGMGGTGMV
ncbi:hypothetical protein [Pantoea agglomerans]|uniref:hypothetical protein n=1 Tax=Enterobacter agglomerans TaxID=549 RepID=UPI0016549E66|nr:hypothetical protein [Pantoea agglomerans]